MVSLVYFVDLRERRVGPGTGVTGFGWGKRIQ